MVFSLFYCGFRIMRKLNQAQRDEEINGTESGGHEDPCHQSPDLALQQMGQIKGEELQRRGIGQEDGQQENQQLAAEDNAHQIVNAEVGMVVDKPIHSTI